MSTIRTRFAPSPTGFLHLGSARTALYNWAYARGLGATFVLRVEDTDRERSTAESERGLLEGLEWLGLDWDEGPIRQSDQAARHREVIEQLLASGAAYRCVCTPDELESRKAAAMESDGNWASYDGRCRDAGHGPDCGPHTVRLRLPEGTHLGWRDLIFGPSGQDANEVGDRNIARTDGTPLYNLAVVVDDLDMQITHVIRGADHHSNTPFQIAIYRALGAEPPEFAHVPLIVNAEGKKLSKRRDPVSIEHYRDEGYLPQALRNWLVRIGWSHGDDEVFSDQQIIQFFNLAAVGRSSGQADIAKLDWLNQHYLKEISADELWGHVSPHLDVVAGHPVERSPALDKLLDLLRERSKTTVDMARQASWFLCDLPGFDEKAAKKHLRPVAREPLAALHEQLGGLTTWDEAFLEEAFNRVCAEQGDLKLGKLAQPVRVAVTGSSASPGIFETVAVLGQERTLARITDALAYIAEREASTS